MINQSRHTVRLRTSLVSLSALLIAAGPGIFTAAAHAAAQPAAQPVAQHYSGYVGPARGQHKVTKPGAAGTANGSFTSTNWDGWVDTNSSSSNTSTFNKVSATWVQPAVTCNGSPSIGSSWVGFDGWVSGSTSVEQGGSDAECLGTTTPSYFLWWEMFPFNASQDVVQINAGDTIHGSVTFDTAKSVFNIVITDQTLNRGLTESIACQADMNGCPRSSAEVISEDTGGGRNVDGLFLLPKYGTETYTNASVTNVSGHRGTLSDSAWVANNVTEVSSDGVTKQTVGALGSGGASFSTAWKQYSGDGVTVRIDYKAVTTAATTTTLDFDLEIVNTGTTTVSIPSVRPEYWFSDEDFNSPLVATCVSAAVGCANISPVFFNGVGTPATATTELVLEFLGGAGDLAPGANSGPIEFRITHQDSSTMTQTNDYSFNAADTTLTPNSLLDAFILGSGPNWGVAPPSAF